MIHKINLGIGSYEGPGVIWAADRP